MTYSRTCCLIRNRMTEDSSVLFLGELKKRTAPVDSIGVICRGCRTGCPEELGHQSGWVSVGQVNVD